MKKYETVKRKEEFNNIIKIGKYQKNDYFVIYKVNNELNYPRFGIAISKKFGKANIRNLYKRRIRTIIDINKNLFQNNKDYIIMIKKNCLQINYQEMNKKFQELLKEN